MAFYESFDEFCRRMGCDHAFLRNRFLFRNGATSDGERVHIDPPSDPSELKKLKREFLQHRLERVTAEFNDMKSYVSEQATMRLRYSNAVPPRSDSVEILKRLQGRVLRLRDSLIEIEADVSTDSPAVLQERRNAEMEQEQRARISQLVAEASQISI